MKTIGDAYVACCGAFGEKLSAERAAERAVRFALAMQVVNLGSLGPDSPPTPSSRMTSLYSLALTGGCDGGRLGSGRACELPDRRAHRASNGWHHRHRSISF